MHIDVPARTFTLRGRPALRPRRVAAVASALALGAALIAVPPGAVAAPPDTVGLFELDGNTHSQPAAGDDWNNIFNGDDTAFTDTGIVADPHPKTIFTGGSSKDDLDITGWLHKDGSVPDKTDISNAYAAAYAFGGDTYTYFGLDRIAVQGSANVGFWFLQGDVAPIPGTPVGTTSGFSGAHEVGDLLILSEFDGGGGNVTLKVFKWVGSGGDEGGGTLETLFGGDSGQAADCDSPDAIEVCANVNTAAIVDNPPPATPDENNIAWPYTAKNGSANMPAAAFFEGGINLDHFFGDAPCFSNMVAETRSSFEVNAVLKDLVHSKFELCGADIEIAADAVNEVGDPHTFTVTASTTSVGVNSPAPDGTVATVTLTDANGDPITATEDTCADPGTVNGQCTVTFSSDVAGVITGHVEADIDVGGDADIHVETGGTGNNPDATKVFADARVSIGADDVNGINEPHTFTVHAEQNDGTGWSDATDGHADVTLTDDDGAVNEIDEDASTCDDLGDNLDDNGECTITFTSGSTGTVTGSATIVVTVDTTEGEIEITRTTDGEDGNTGTTVKEFVDGSLIWHKVDDKGDPLVGASFEVCQTHTLDTSTTPDTPVAVAEEDQVCVIVLDNDTSDADAADGEFKLEDLELGRYSVDEVAPFPPGYAPDESVKTADLTLEPGPKDAEITEAFINTALYRLIVVTCNTTTGELVDSTVTLGDDVRETVKASELGAIAESALCGLAGANYNNLTSGEYTPTVELPDVAPLHPVP